MQQEDKKIEAKYELSDEKRERMGNDKDIFRGQN